MLNQVYLSLKKHISLLLSLSICTMPIGLSANNVDNCSQAPCCENNCYEYDNIFGNWKSWIGGALLGAATGAATAAAISSNKKGHRGPRGPMGLPGSSCTFTTDGTNTLTFNATLTVEDSVAGMAAVFFVGLPNGSVIQNPPILLPASGVVNFSPLTVSPAIFGDYDVGIQLSGNASLGVGAELLFYVLSSRDGSTTTISNETPDVLVAGSLQTQTSSNFIYGESPTP